MKQRSLPRRAAPKGPLLLQTAAERSRQGKFDEAEQLYKVVLADDARSLDALRGYGLFLLQRRRGVEAVQSLDAAVQVAPNDAGAWCELGMAQTSLGRLQEAVACYDRSLAVDPRHVGALTNRGNALVGLNRPLEACDSYERALAVNPRLVAALSNRGGLLRELGRSAEALESLDKALAIAPDNADALSNRANALVELGREEEALSSYDMALAVNPNSVNTHNNRGNLLLKLRRAEEALACYDRALGLQAPNAETLANRASALRALKRYAEALDGFAKALALAPLRAQTLHNLANTLLELNRPQEALARYDHALARNPDYVDALTNRSSALIALKQPLEALASCDKALTLAPQHVPALSNRAGVLISLGREAEALASCDAAIAVRPDFASAHANKGVAVLHLGRLEEASAAFETAIALDPAHAHAYYHLAKGRRFERDDPRFAGLEDLIRNEASLSDQDRIYAHFAMGKVLADVGNYGPSFGHVIAGNAIKRRLAVYDEAGALGVLQRTRVAYAAGLIERLGECGAASATPVFVFGMPRSGTTLVEQILASHPDVHGAGEINDFDLAASALGGKTAEALTNPEAVWQMTAEHFRRLGEDYVERIEGRAPSARRVVNKMTENFRHAGLIALALPKARIIHVQRDPLDVCLSCFTNLFVDDLLFVNDLGELGRYYRGYEGLMAHWRQALPKGMMIEVRYEEIVADLEGEGRRILEHCGLDWDSRCLDFHKSERTIRTASVEQARRPLYDTSVGRWRRYEAFLGPLIAALGPSAGGLDGFSPPVRDLAVA